MEELFSLTMLFQIGNVKSAGNPQLILESSLNSLPQSIINQKSSENPTP